MVSYNRGKKKERINLHDHAYWGPSFTNEYVNNLIKSKKVEFENENCEVENFSDIEKLIKIVAKEIEKGK